MAFTINNKSMTDRLGRHLRNAQKQNSDAITKLSSGQVFTSEDPRPSERALADKLEFKLRGLASAKRNVNDAVSLLQIAESSMGEINNIITRMKEINIAAASTTVNDTERKYLFIEYEALHDEIDRVAKTTEFNGIPLLNGHDSKTPDELIFRLGDPAVDEDGGGGIGGENDINTLRFTGMKELSATTEALGLKSVASLLGSSSLDEGISIEDAQELMEPEDDIFSNIYDQALTNLSKQRAVFGAVGSRLNRSLDYIDVYQENISAAKSKMADTDYVDAVAALTESKIRMSASTSLLTQANFTASATANILSTVIN